MKLGRLNSVALAAIGVCLANSTAVAQGAVDQWERGTDPVTATAGLRHVASNIYVTCAERSGFIRVSVPSKKNRVIALGSGMVKSSLAERALAGGRVHGVTLASDPLYSAVVASRKLMIDGKALTFSDKDHRYFSLFTRVCKEVA